MEKTTLILFEARIKCGWCKVCDKIPLRNVELF